MKILYVVKNMRLSNGVSSYVMNYYRHIKDETIKIDFLVISDVGSPYYEEIKKNNSKIFLLPSYRKQPVKMFNYLNQLFKNNYYDVVHCNVMNSGSLILKMAYKYKVPVRIIHSHATQTGDQKWKQIRNKLFCSFTLHYANEYFSCSQLAGDYIFGKDNYTVIPNAIDINKYVFNPVIRQELREKNNCLDELIIMTVGRFTKQKNPFFIVDIVEALSKENIKFKFWWFGNGELEDEVKQYAKTKDVDQYIKFWGASNNVNQYYSVADIFILPSLYEGLPVVGIEAQVAGLPTLLANTITKETQIVKEVKFLPINNSTIWSKQILKYKNFERTENMRTKKLEGYCINEQSKKMMNIYKKLLESKTN